MKQSQAKIRAVRERASDGCVPELLARPSFPLGAHTYRVEAAEEAVARRVHRAPAPRPRPMETEAQRSSWVRGPARHRQQPQPLATLAKAVVVWPSSASPATSSSADEETPVSASRSAAAASTRPDSSSATWCSAARRIGLASGSAIKFYESTATRSRTPFTRRSLCSPRISRCSCSRFAASA
ncbi:unnamed protein product [Trichogramma brassicae]|uniref:Uncharacterized protein n=1 Tax=Trichogramma brassicae TaxID=86971 RepID=A0A6H5IH54_9HYME|nr:unnamed protein product [Trichogramma brassicae]